MCTTRFLTRLGVTASLAAVLALSPYGVRVTLSGMPGLAVSVAQADAAPGGDDGGPPGSDYGGSDAGPGGDRDQAGDGGPDGHEGGAGTGRVVPTSFSPKIDAAG